MSIPTRETGTSAAIGGGDPLEFAQSGKVVLRSYQRDVLNAIARAVRAEQGGTFAVMFPRQSGKNEAQAQLEAYLLHLFMEVGGDIVKFSPTFEPQARIGMRRLEKALAQNPLTEPHWRKEGGGIYRVGQARATFLSAAGEAHVVGATASVLLEVDEAQDVSISKYDKEIAPMAASTNAVRVFWGTAWTRQTLLARELAEARAAGRAFVVNADEVALEVPAYGRFVQEQIARLGREHPAIRTQFFCEELDAGGGMFGAERQARMHSGRMFEAPAGGTYAILIDVGGEETAEGSNRRAQRDATAATVVWVDLATLAAPLLRAPTYRPVERRLWVGASHVDLYQELLGLAAHYAARRVVIDATGVGAGLAAFLERALPGRVARFVFNLASKSQLGWDFLTLVDQGRWQEPVFPPTPNGAAQEALQALFIAQAEGAQQTILTGAGRLMRWGVPDEMRHPVSGQPLHDDLLISAALAAVLDRQPWSAPGSTVIIQRKDPLEEMKGF